MHVLEKVANSDALPLAAARPVRCS